MDDRNWLKYGAIALAVVGFVALAALALASEDRLEGKTWIVHEMVVEGTAGAPLPGTVLTAFFDDGSVNGVAGCNNYFAGYEVDGSSIEVGPVGSTQVFCSEPEGVMDQEFAYLGLLGTVDRYDRDGDRLTLLQGDNVLVIYNVATVEHHDQ